MVAITVILAAVIAAFVFGMAGGISNTKSVAATAQQEGDTIYVTYQGGQDSLDVSSIKAYVPDATSAAGSVIVIDSPSVGDVAAFDVGAGGVRNHVVVTATFADATSQVILDTYV
jgi:FlaG/FlaF family flagellin (archaellin)